MIDKILKNRFDMTKPNSGFVDNFSDMEVCIGKGFLSISAMNNRGLDSWRDTVAEKLCQPFISINGDKRRFPICIDENECYPWAVNQKGNVSAEGQDISVRSTLCSPNTNTLLWFLEFESQVDAAELELSFKGKLAYKQKNHEISICDHGIKCVFNHGKTDEWTPVWSLRSQFAGNASFDSEQATYWLNMKPFSLSDKKPYIILLQIDYDIVKKNDTKGWMPCGFINCTAEGILSERKKWWTDILSRVVDGKNDNIKKIRSAAGLVRCGSKWQSEEGEIIAPYCSISNWSSLVCFWDAIIASVGLSYFDFKLSADAIRAAFFRQKENGFVTSTTYKFAPHNEIYPQPPITGWALMKLLDNVPDKALVWGFIKEILPKVHRLHQWYIHQQDFDGDGLPEWRFTGSIADNSPLYDRYAAPINKELGSMWNIYIPPVASVSLASFLIMESKCLSFFYNELGDKSMSNQYTSEAAELGEKLKSICFNGELFHDYDHLTGEFNEIITLYSFLPLWAGVEMEKDIKRKMIEKYLLSADHFFGDYPLPYISYSEKTYKPDGYWRGRIWPHVTLWMLELLTENGYEEHADIMANKLLDMMNQREEPLENYNSSPDCPGGGEPDFLWSFASYLAIENKMYKNCTLNIITKQETE